MAHVPRGVGEGLELAVARGEAQAELWVARNVREDEVELGEQLGRRTRERAAVHVDGVGKVGARRDAEVHERADAALVGLDQGGRCPSVLRGSAFDLASSASAIFRASPVPRRVESMPALAIAAACASVRRVVPERSSSSWS